MKRIALFLLLLFMMCAGASKSWAQRGTPARIVLPINAKKIERLIHERHGKALLLNVWATWCAPCVEEFPDLIRLHDIYRDSLVEIIAISVDYPDETASKIIPFLDTLHVPFTVFVADVQKPEELITVLNPTWSGAVPATFVFDRQGLLRTSLVGRKGFDVFKAEAEKAKSN